MKLFSPAWFLYSAFYAWRNTFLGLDFGIDRLFFDPYITTGVQKPGRMAPNTVLSFAFASLGLLGLGLPTWKAARWYYLGLVMLGSLVMALGTVALFGYLTNITSAYGWGQQTWVALNTTFGMITLGLCIIACTIYKVHTVHNRLTRWLPLLLFITGVTIAVLLWQALLDVEGVQLDQTTSVAAKIIQGDLDQGIDYRLLLLNRIGQRWETVENLKQSVWEKNTLADINDFGGIQAIALADPALNVSWVVPNTGNESLVNRPFLNSETTRSALVNAATTRRIVLITVETAGPLRASAGFAAFVPLFKNGIIAGYIIGIFQNQTLIEEILSHSFVTQYRLTITTRGQTIFFQESVDGPPTKSSVQREQVNFDGIEWQIQIKPGPRIQKGQQSWLPTISLFGGLLIASLLSMVTFLAQTSRNRARRIQQTNLELLRTEELYRTLARNLPESAVLLFDTDFRFTLAEGPALAKRGLQKQEVEGRTIQEVFPHKVAKTIEDAYQKALEGTPAIFEQVFQQTIFQVQILLVKNEVAKIFTGMLVFQDITERKRNEQIKTEFISTVSHELRTPLNSIQGSLGLVVGGITGPLNPPTLGLLDIAYKNCSRLIRLINDMLDVEKIESGKMVSNKQPIELAPIIEQAIQANRAYGEQFQVTFHLQENPVDVRAQADSDQLIQVLNNLLSNAAKYSPLGGTVEIGVKVQEQKVRVSITDQSKGVPVEFQSRIFQKFSQADSSDTRQKGGTGLGLSIVKALMDQHDGPVGFTSNPNGGTCFFFELPILSPDAVVVELASTHSQN